MPGAFWRNYSRHRVASLALSQRVRVESGASGGILWLDLDAGEQRFLLSAAADASIELYDTHDAALAAVGAPVALAPVGRVAPRRHPGAHRFLVSGAAWYPVDSGIFVTGSFDGDVKVWDANGLQVACTFPLEDRVHCVAMSAIATSHCLVAAGLRTPSQGVVLCDVSSGAATHRLSGHRDAVWTAAWSGRNEHELITGDASGQVRVWDVRRAGCRHVLDMHTTTASHRPPRRSGAPPAAGRRRRRAAADAETAAGPGVGGSSGEGRYAHDGGVTAVHATAAGSFLLTSGRDSRLRLWDAHPGAVWRHLLVHYPDTHNKAGRGVRLATTPDERHVFQPCGSMVQVFDVQGGQLLAELRQGHYDAVNAAVWSAAAEQLFTAGSDGSIVVWEQQLLADGGGDDGGHGPAGNVAADVDAWSDDLPDVDDDGF